MAAKAQFTTNALFAGNSFGQTNQIWRYEEVADLTGTGWEQKNYNDSGWASGRALLAFEATAWVNPFRNTVLMDPRLASNPPVGHARYFRTHFTWTGSAAGGTLLFNARLDDGALIYLNGVEVFRLRPPPDPITHAAVGSPLPCGGDADCGDDVFTVASPALVEGDNVLAVAVYQNATGSSDVVWGTGLAGIPGVPPAITDPNQPTNRIAIANQRTTLSMSVLGSPTPSFRWFFEPTGGGGFNPVVDGPGISGGTNASLTISNMAASNAGRYFCTASNPVGMINSRTAVVQFTDDTNGPVMLEALGSASFDRITLVYNEQLEPVSATDTFNYSIAGPGGPLGINSITLNADGSSVSIMTDPQIPQTPDTLYTITVNSVTDLSANAINPDSTIIFHSWVLTSCGGVLFEAYLNTGAGNSVNDLTSHPSFPNQPSEVIRINGFDSRLAYPDGPHEGYGARMRALFIPPESGNWRLYLHADDGSQLWFNPNGPESAGRQLLLNRTACCGDFTSANSRTAPLPLLAGRAYYLETLYKEGTGGDYCHVAALLDGLPTPPVSEFIPGTLLGATAAPPGIGGTINFSQQPTNTVVDAPAQATFSAVASAPSAPFVCYQWQKAEAGGGGAFSDILGATTPTFTTPITSVAADNGDMYRVVVNSIGGSATSAVATLTVNVDVRRPTVVKVVPTTNTAVSVVYSEAMDPTAATTLANYSLSGGVSIQSAVVNGGNPSRVDLTTTPMTIGTLYTLTMKGPGGGGTLADLSGNALNPTTATATFRAQSYNGNVDTLRGLPTTGKLPLGSLSTRGIMIRFVQVSAAIANDNTVAEQMLDGVYPNATTPLPNIAPTPLYLETGMINYNKDGPTSMDGNLVPDAQFPGFGNMPLAVLDNLAMEAVCYLELQQGIYRMIVRSDDGFRLTAALSADDPGNSFIIGEFNGGRGTADTPLNDLIVAEAGLYPMRLIFEEGQGGAAIEWKIQDFETGNYFGVNGTSLALAGGFPGGGPSGYLPPCVNKSMTVQKSGANLVISWLKNGGGNQFQLQQANVLSNPSSSTSWSNVGAVPKTTGSTKTVTVPLSSAANFYRLFRPGPPCTP